MSKINIFPEDIEDIFEGIHNEFKLVKAKYIDYDETLIVKQNKTGDLYRIDYDIDNLTGRFKNIKCKLTTDE